MIQTFIFYQQIQFIMHKPRLTEAFDTAQLEHIIQRFHIREDFYIELFKKKFIEFDCKKCKN